jgi:hypothetical protein
MRGLTRRGWEREAIWLRAHDRHGARPPDPPAGRREHPHSRDRDRCGPDVDGRRRAVLHGGIERRVEHPLRRDEERRYYREDERRQRKREGDLPHPRRRSAPTTDSCCQSEQEHRNEVRGHPHPDGDANGPWCRRCKGRDYGGRAKRDHDGQPWREASHAISVALHKALGHPLSHGKPRAVVEREDS